MPGIITFREDNYGAEGFQKSLRELPASVRRAALQPYFLRMFTATEQIFAQRFNNVSGKPKQRPWAFSWDNTLQRKVLHGQRPLIRTGLLMQSLASSGKHAIRQIFSRFAIFGTSRMSVSGGRVYDLLDIVSGGRSPGASRVRVPIRYGRLKWEPQQGFRVSTSRPTSDAGATIPPRPMSFKHRPLTADELKRMNAVAHKYWTDYFRRTRGG
jgi:hypothetical protein